MAKVLVVEDTDSLRRVLCSVLETEGHALEACASAEEALDKFPDFDFECIISDFRLPKSDGISLLGHVRKVNQKVPFLLMTGYGSVDLAVDAMKQGANDYLAKPFEPERLCRAVKDLVEHRFLVERALGQMSGQDRQFISCDPAGEKLLAQAQKVAKVDSTVLICGESGTGKELIARFVHQHSKRASGPFFAVNCAALPGDLLESEFFGHEAGSFTGATQSRAGIFELATDGTIFLDEIAEMPPRLQVKLLRALQEREIKRIGGNRLIKVNPRIIAATNRDIDEALAQGTLREDLYYRLAVISFSITPLRDRPADIRLLADYFLGRVSKKMGKYLSFSAEALQALQSYGWPGNARELENAVERAAVLCDTCITPDSLDLPLGINFDSIDNAAATLGDIAAAASREAEVAMIKRTLERTAGNKSKAAELLGVSYKTLLNKVKEYQL